MCRSSKGAHFDSTPSLCFLSSSTDFFSSGLLPLHTALTSLSYGILVHLASWYLQVGKPAEACAPNNLALDLIHKALEYAVPSARQSCTAARRL